MTVDVILAFALCVLTVQQQPAPATVDTLVLDLGEELTGRIVLETADYVEIEIGPGTVVGLERRRITSITRATVRAEPAAAVLQSAGLQPRDDWNVLHDGSGRAVGWMHATITPADGGGVRIGEEWRFVGTGQTVETTLLEVLDADGMPESAFCHERIRSADDRLSADRVVNAVVRDGRLEVRIGTPRETRSRSYDFDAGTRFPLELRAELRGRPAGARASETYRVFDPLTEQFEERTFEFGATRHVDLGGGQPANVRVLTATGVRGRNSEWLDASARPLRREVAGPALVAVPVASEAEARRRAQEAHAAFPPAFRTELGGSFGVWLPSPAWSFVETERSGEVTAQAPFDEASMSLVRLDHLDPGLGLQSAADSVLRWLRLVHDRLEILDRVEQTIRGTRAVRLRGRAFTTEGTRVELLVHVLQLGDHWFVSCGTAPRIAFARVEPELRWMVERFELHREGFAPELHGPLAERGGRRR